MARLIKNQTSSCLRARVELIKKGYDYLNMNFHKFDQKTRVHVALEIVKRDMQVETEGQKPNVIVQIIHAMPRDQGSGSTPGIPGHRTSVAIGSQGDV